MPITATGVGDGGARLSITGPGFTGTQHFALGIEAGAPTSTPQRASRSPAAARRSPTRCWPISSPAPASISVAASPFGAIDAPALLQALDRYPYGCSEQTVSRAMPLLYANGSPAPSIWRSIPISTDASRARSTRR
jgi:uncharacterized protein YfaS (alpha-2-macroglobulin family)